MFRMIKINKYIYALEYSEKGYFWTRLFSSSYVDVHRAKEIYEREEEKNNES